MGRRAKAYIKEYLENMKVHDKIANENIRWKREQNKIRHDLQTNVPGFQFTSVLTL